MIFLGCDPGKSGSTAAVLPNGMPDGEPVRHDGSDRDIAEEFILRSAAPIAAFAVIEQVSAMPKQGVSSTFKFGRSFGFLEGCLTARLIPYELVRPQAWQKAMACLSGGDKNVTKAAAQRLWPDPGFRITHRNADALLLAEYGRRLWVSRGARPA